MNKNRFTPLLPLLFSVFGITCSANILAAEDPLLKQAQALFKPLPADMGTPDFPATPDRVALGQMLFFDPRASIDGSVSCAHCHQPAFFGTDALPRSIGVADRNAPRNAPTVLNAALHFVSHWRGDRTNVEEQATKALIAPASFGQLHLASSMNSIAVIEGYLPLFQKAFPKDKNPITAENWGKAIGAYERTLVTPSPFDAYLKGDANALSPAAKAGLQKFIATGCSSCHNGVGVGGGMYQKFGLLEDYWKATGSKEIDRGRFDVTREDADKFVFKVPSLRNVAMTPPYFHDGSVAALPQAVRVMARVQLGKQLSDQEVESIVAFLNSLTGTLPRNFATAPTLPPGVFHPQQQ